jgi:hypothetical protein
MPVSFGDMDTQCEREEQVGKTRFIPWNMMRTAVSGSEETFKIRCSGGFRRFGITLLTLVFRTLILGWQIILSGAGTRDASSEIEMATLTQWRPEQDFFLDTRTVIPPPRMIEERGRGTYVRRYSDLHHILDHQAEVGRSIRLGVGLWDGDGRFDVWFTVPVQPESSIDEYEVLTCVSQGSGTGSFRYSIVLSRRSYRQVKSLRFTGAYLIQD